MKDSCHAAPSPPSPTLPLFRAFFSIARSSAERVARESLGGQTNGQPIPLARALMNALFALRTEDVDREPADQNVERTPAL
jgi:hypothetical protein